MAKRRGTTNVIFNECAEEEREQYRKDRRSYYRDCLRIRDRTGTGIIPFEPNAGQQALENLRDRIEEFHRKVAGDISKQTGKSVRPEPVRMIVLKSRRVGFSTDIAAQMFHFCEFNKGKNGLVVAHLQPNANNIAQISRRFQQQFPKDRAGIKIPMIRESEEIEWGDVADQPWDSRIIIATAASRNFARSFEYNMVHLSECAHYKSPDAIASAKDAAQFAEYIYEESTANGMDPYFYSSWEGAKHLSQVKKFYTEKGYLPPDWNGKYKFFWAWWQDPECYTPLTLLQAERVMSELSKKEEEGIEKWGWAAEQIEWRRRKIAGDCSEQTQMDPEDYFDQEYPSSPEVAFITSGKTVFPSIHVASMKSKKKPKSHGNITAFSPQLVITPNGKDSWESSNLAVWAEPDERKQYILGGRVAEGKKHGDYSVAIVMERSSSGRLKEVATYRGQCTGIELGEICINLAVKYNNAFIIPEATVPTLAHYIAKRGYPFVYQRKNEEQVSETNAKTFTPGFKCWRTNKQMVINHSQDAFRKGNVELHSPWLIKEHLQFVNIDGDMQAPSGGTDDGVIIVSLCVFADLHAAPPVRELPEEFVPPTQEELIWSATESKKKSSLFSRRVVRRRIG